MHHIIQVGLIIASFLVSISKSERVLGAYIYSRHGDRTPKVFGHTALTNLGYREVFVTGSYYHDRYIASDSVHQIEGISDTLVNSQQINASAPSDSVIQNSATGFLQGVYPPAQQAAFQVLGNGTRVQSPLGGYQLIQLQTAGNSQNSESSDWLQGASNCKKSAISSSNYYASSSYESLLDSTRDFYASLSPMLEDAFTSEEMSFENAYTIFDYLNVGLIHNSTKEFPLRDNLTTEVYAQLLQLANNQQYNLAYNQSDPVRAIDGAVLAGQILSSLESTITSGGKFKLGVELGSYGTFLSFFGLMQLPAASVNFTGVCDYASTFALELVTNATGTGIPSEDQISVRFMFHNGTISGSQSPTVYPLFGQSNDLLSWNDFKSHTEKIAILSDAHWCSLCGNTQGICASFAANDSSSASSESSGDNSGGISRVVAGVIGAIVTLGVLLVITVLCFLVGGLRISRRHHVADLHGSETSSANMVKDSEA